MSRLLTTREVAEMLGLSPATILRRWRAGELPGYRIGSNCLRFSEAELLDWLQSTRGSAYSLTTLQQARSEARVPAPTAKLDADTPTERG